MPGNQLSYSKSGFRFTKSFEALRLEAYQDKGGVWTVGYGHTGGVFAGMVISQLQAEQFLLADVQLAVQCVNQAVAVALTQEEFDALVDFVFNVGAGNFAHSSLLRCLNAGDYVGAAAQFERWDHVGGVVCAGLLRRRIAETQEFVARPALETEKRSPAALA